VLDDENAQPLGAQLAQQVGQGLFFQVAQAGGPPPPNAAAVPLTRFCRASRMESCCAKSSSNLSRCHAGNAPSESWWMVKLGGGECKRRRLSARCGSFRRPNKASGKVSCSGVTSNAV